MMPMPQALRDGRMFLSASPTARSLTPKAMGIEGPVMSASRMAVLSPRLAAATASCSVTRLLPTPPLPLMTAMTRLTFDFAFAGTLKSFLSHPPLDAQFEQS